MNNGDPPATSQTDPPSAMAITPRLNSLRSTATSNISPFYVKFCSHQLTRSAPESVLGDCGHAAVQRMHFVLQPVDTLLTADAKCGPGHGLQPVRQDLRFTFETLAVIAPIDASHGGLHLPQ